MKAVNLLPRQENQTDTPKSKGGIKLFAVGGLAVVVAALVTGYVIAGNDVQSQQSALASANAELAAVQAQNGSKNWRAAWTNRAQNALGQDRTLRADALASVLSKRVAWDRVLRKLTLVIPDDIWLTSLDGKTPISDDLGQTATLVPPAPTPPPAATTTTTTTTTSSTPTPPPAPVVPTAPPAPTGLTLQGYGYSQDGVARLLSRLQVVPDLTNIQLQTSKVTQVAGRNVVQFTIMADVRRLGDS
jgi:Tfp pilus assembly protein PilN